MRGVHDEVVTSILRTIGSVKEPLETKEILEKLQGKNITRTKIFYRLTNLRGDGLIKGKFVGPGKGVWIWWALNLFNREVKK